MRNISVYVLVRDIGGLCNLEIYLELPWARMLYCRRLWTGARITASSSGFPLDAARPENRDMPHRERFAQRCAGAVSGGARGGKVVVGYVSLRRSDFFCAARGPGKGRAVSGTSGSHDARQVKRQ